MKKIQNIAIVAAMVPVVLFSSCSNDFFDRTPETAMDTEVVLSDPSLVPSTVVGTMGMMSSAGAWGRDLTVVGDVMTDLVSTIRSNQGTMRDIEQWIITTSSTDAASYWAGPYQIAASAARTVEAAKRLLADSASLNETEITNLNSAIAASLTIKVLCEYTLAQFFCVDYNLTDVPGNNPTKVGLILLRDRALNTDEPANMSSLEDSYTFMEQEIAEAIERFEAVGGTFTLQVSQDTRFYPTLGAAYMVQARVYLAQHQYQEALTAVENALANLPSGAQAELITTEEALVDAYGETPSSEDIWLLNYTTQDNLSANSLNTLFGSYGFSPTKYAVDLFNGTDIRSALYGGWPDGVQPSEESSSWCLKYPADNGVFNVPVLRVPELYLMKAECQAAMNDVASARTTLIENLISKRDTVIDMDNYSNYEAYSDLAGTEWKSGYDNNGVAEGFLAGLLKEYTRELLCEGQRWSTLRRNGVSLNRNGSATNEQFRSHFLQYPVSRFSFPVPFVEFTTQQWIDGRPIDLNGKFIPGQNANWQTNAWDKPNGQDYSPQIELPQDGYDYNNRNDQAGTPMATAK